MKIAYVCYWDMFAEDGVVKKIDSQVGFWRGSGHEVEVFCLSPVRHNNRPPTLAAQAYFFGSLRERFRATRMLVCGVERFEPDLIYLRYDLFLPPFQRLLRALPSAVEVQGDDIREIPLRKLRARPVAIYNSFYRRTILGRASGIICVTHELARSPIFASFGKPTVVIANGIDLAPLYPLGPTSGGRFRLAFLGSRAQTWHGVDKIVALADLLPELDFDVIGFEPDDFAEQLPDNVRAHGVLSRKQYEPVLARADAAIGTLALHRKGMTEACPLKVREYLAYGIPTIVGYEDTDFAGETPWFLLQLPNTEMNALDHAEEIRAFAERMRGRRIPRKEIADRIGAEAKETARLEFMHRLLKDA